jgi:hypothetical protein
VISLFSTPQTLSNSSTPSSTAFLLTSCMKNASASHNPSVNPLGPTPQPSRGTIVSGSRRMYVGLDYWERGYILFGNIVVFQRLCLRRKGYDSPREKDETILLRMFQVAFLRLEGIHRELLTRVVQWPMISIRQGGTSWPNEKWSLADDFERIRFAILWTQGALYHWPWLTEMESTPILWRNCLMDRRIVGTIYHRDIQMQETLPKWRGRNYSQFTLGRDGQWTIAARDGVFIRA